MSVSVYKGGTWYPLAGQRIFKDNIPYGIKHNDYMYYDGQWHRISDLYMGRITMTPQAHNSSSVSVASAKSYISVTRDGGSPSYATVFPANIQVSSQVTVIQGDVLVFSCSGTQLQSITFSGMIPLLNFQCASCGLTQIDLSTFQYLRTLNIQRNELTSLDTRMLPRLYQLYANNNSLSTQNIDQILQFFAYSGITGGTCYLQDQTTGAGPSQTGLQYIEMMQNNGWNVSV